MFIDEYWPYFVTGVVLYISFRLTHVFGSGKLKRLLNRCDESDNRKDVSETITTGIVPFLCVFDVVTFIYISFLYVYIVFTDAICDIRKLTKEAHCNIN